MAKKIQSLLVCLIFPVIFLLSTVMALDLTKTDVSYDESRCDDLGYENVVCREDTNLTITFPKGNYESVACDSKFSVRLIIDGKSCGNFDGFTENKPYSTEGICIMDLKKLYENTCGDRYSVTDIGDRFGKTWDIEFVRDKSQDIFERFNLFIMNDEEFGKQENDKTNFFLSWGMTILGAIGMMWGLSNKNREKKITIFVISIIILLVGLYQIFY